jgi:hypothetical protein
MWMLTFSVAKRVEGSLMWMLTFSGAKRIEGSLECPEVIPDLGL